MEKRKNLIVPFSEKDDAKALGAKWDEEQSLWYIIYEKEEELEKFSKWILSNEEIIPICQKCKSENVFEVMEHNIVLKSLKNNNTSIKRMQMGKKYYCGECKSFTKLIPQEIRKEDFLLLIDGSSLLATNYYGTLPPEIRSAKTKEEEEKYYKKIMQTSTGIYTNAVYETLSSILKIITIQKPSYIAVAFDKTRDTFRRKIYPEYKANRKETPAPLKQQMELVQEVLKKIGIPVFIDENYEADDLIGTLAATFENILPVVLYTKDSDYLQLVTDKTTLWKACTNQTKADELYIKYNLKRENVPDKVFPFDYGLIYDEFGIFPEQIIDLKAIEGDTSDNIPGVKGVSSAAAVLLNEYDSIEGIYKAIDEAEEHKTTNELKNYWKNELGLKRSPYNALVTYRKDAFLSKELATIVKDIDMKVSLKDLKVKVNTDNLKKVFEELEIKSLDKYVKMLTMV